MNGETTKEKRKKLQTRGANNNSASAIENTGESLLVSPVRGTKGSSRKRRGKKGMNGSSHPIWNRSLAAYPNSELRAIRFRSEREIDRAIDLCWSDPDLKGLPRDIADGKTLIVPADAIPYLTKKGLKFTVSTLLDKDDLPPDEFSKMRRAQGI